MKDGRGDPVYVDGAKLRAARGEWRRQSDVARHFGWHPQELEAWEAERRPVPAHKLALLCKLYKVSRVSLEKKDVEESAEVTACVN